MSGYNMSLPLSFRATLNMAQNVYGSRLLLHPIDLTCRALGQAVRRTSVFHTHIQSNARANPATRRCGATSPCQ